MDTKKIFSEAPVEYPELSSLFTHDGAQRRGKQGPYGGNATG
ncbi:MAG TPA: hypothetical protein VIG87_02440 [Candidatus Udaeobacter sp.]